MTEEIKEKIEDAHDKVKEELDEALKKVESLKAEAKRQAARAEGYAQAMADDAEKFFNKYQVPVIVAGAVLVVVSFVAGALIF